MNDKDEMIKLEIVLLRDGTILVTRPLVCSECSNEAIVATLSIGMLARTLALFKEVGNG